ATEPASQCNTGPVQCCDSTTSAITPSLTTLLTSLGISASSVAVPIGLTCTPISVVGVGSGATCNAEPVCCENNNYQGVVALGCSPVNLAL
ncbi:fungal hydrophobin, partial [Leucogyrophana mollusca]